MFGDVIKPATNVWSRYSDSLLLDPTIMVSQYCPTIGEHVVFIMFFNSKSTVNYSFRGL